MKVLDIPFNQFIGLEKSNSDNYLLKLELKKEYLNHLGTMHASALFSIAEATSGQFLLDQFKTYQLNIIPVVRKVEIKYSKPGNTSIYSKARLTGQTTESILNELNLKKRIIIKVKVDIYGNNNDKLMSSIFDWFVTLI